MPFTCFFCKAEIRPGEPIQADTAMQLAHKSCAEFELQKIESLAKPVVPPPPPAPPSPPPVLVVQTDAPPSQLHLVREIHGCAECHKPAISMCPACRTYVHQGYGYDGQNCSGRHEGKCEGARESRNRVKPPVDPTDIFYKNQTLSEKQARVYADLPKLKRPIKIAEPILTVEDGVLSKKNGNGVHKKRKGRR